MCKYAVKKLPFMTKYVPDPYKTKEVYDIVILQNGRILGFILDSCESQKMSDKAVDNYAFTLKFVPKFYKTQKNNAVNTSPSAIPFVPECYKTQEMCDKAVVTCFFVFDFVLDQIITLQNVR